MIKKQHKRKYTPTSFSEPNEGERTLLCSNKCGIRSPSLDFLDTSAVSEEVALEYLAEIIGMIYLKKHRGFNRKEGRHILPGVNKGASGGRQ